jgi:hypothetical protein
MKTLILILGCLLLVIPCQAVEEQSERQTKEFEKIERYIARQRRSLENYYRDQFAELKQRTQSKIRLLEVADKAIYANLAGQAEVARTVLHINDYGYRAPWYLVANTEEMLQLKDERESYGDFEDSFQESPKRFAVAHSWITERKNRILAKLEWEAASLEQQKQYALNEGLVQLEKQLKEEALKPEPEATRGMVTGVLYSIYKPSAIVDHKVVHEGDTIYGATVIRIYKDKVRFSKEGKNWEQGVQQSPESYWK